MYTVKKYNSDWLNKKLNGQELGRIGGGAERMQGRRRQGHEETQRKYDVKISHESPGSM